MAALLGSAALAACTTDVVAFASKWLEPGELQVVDTTFARAEAGEWDAMKASFHESVADVGSDEAWATIAETLAGADLAGRTLIGVNVNAANGQRNASLVFEGPGDQGWYAARVDVRDGELYGFSVEPIQQSFVSANAFSIGSVGLPHVALFALGLVSIVIASVASWRVLRSDMRGRGLWAALSWVMVGGVNLNWVTGQMGVQLLKVQVPPITFLKAGPAAPWIFGFGLPVFALIALRKASRAESYSADEPLEDEDPDPPDSGT